MDCGSISRPGVGSPRLSHRPRRHCQASQVPHGRMEDGRGRTDTCFLISRCRLRPPPRRVEATAAAGMEEESPSTFSLPEMARGRPKVMSADGS